MIEMRDVTIRAGQFSLERISFQIPAGRYAVLMGKTGRGKTTLLELVCGLRRPTSGSILIHGQDMTDWSPADRMVGYVPQDLALFPTMNVQEHLEFALRLKKFPRAKIAERTGELAEVLGIKHLLKRSVRRLSGGESQRVALGRAIANRPTVLLLDEPLSALDAATRHEMHELLRTIKKSTGVTILHVTHNVEEAEILADQRLLLEDGKLMASN